MAITIIFIPSKPVLDPGEGVCADPVNRDAILGEGGAGSSRQEQGASVESGQGKREDVILGEMRRRREDKEDNPFMALGCQHAQSELMCIARKIKNKCVDDVYIFVYLLNLLFQENK